MARLWIPVTAQEAKKHPLYGVKNWLAVFAFGVLFSLLQELGSLSSEAYKAGVTISELFSIDHPSITFVKLALTLETATVAAIYWLLLTKHPKFRLVASAILLCSWPAVAIAGAVNSFPELAQALTLSFFPWLISCTVWVTYLQRSKRVRITFEHCILLPNNAAEPGRAQSRASPAPAEPSLSRHQPTSPLAQGNVQPAHLPIPPADTSRSDVPAERFWSDALAELEGTSRQPAPCEFDGTLRRPGLWARAFSEAQGNEAIAKATYLRLRATELAHEHQLLAERDSQKVLLEAARERKHSQYVEGLTALQRELRQNIHQAQLNESASFGALIALIRLLDGKADWKSVGLFRAAWVVQFESTSLVFATDGELKSWATTTVLPAASHLLPPEEASDT